MDRLKFQHKIINMIQEELNDIPLEETVLMLSELISAITLKAMDIPEPIPVAEVEVLPEVIPEAPKKEYKPKKKAIATEEFLDIRRLDDELF